MAVTITSVANRALQRLGSPRITSLDADTSSATELREAWGPVRQAELRTYRWKFALRRMLLPAAATAPAWGFARAFPLPPNCCRVLQVGRYRQAQPAYEIEAGAVLTDAEAPLPVLIVIDEENVGRWDPAFAEAFSARLAYELCERLTGNAGKRKLAWEDYQDTIRTAKRAGALETKPRDLVSSEPWLEYRESG